MSKPHDSDLMRLEGPAAAAWCDEHGNEPDADGGVTVARGQLGRRFEKAATFVRARVERTADEIKAEQAAESTQLAQARMDGMQAQVSELKAMQAQLMEQNRQLLAALTAPKTEA